jgi:hypothetical protein
MTSKERIASIFNEKPIDLNKIMDDLDLEELLEEFRTHGNKRIKKFKKRRYMTFMSKKFYDLGSMNSVELSLKLFKIYINTGVFVEKPIKSISQMPQFEYKIVI